MFDDLKALPDDPILKISAMCNADSRADKIDVGVGIFQDEHGKTPVLQAVKKAEQILIDTQNSKKYLALEGNSAFNEQIARLILGANYNAARVNQSTAGTGALSLLAHTLKNLQNDLKLCIPNPTWGNHRAIFTAANWDVDVYPYYDSAHATAQKEQMWQHLTTLGKSDVLIVHGCCHNPSGADFTPEDWQQLAQLAQQNGFIIVVDLAYLGFANDIERDAQGIRILAQQLPLFFVAFSCSKNFSLYRERAGALLTIGDNDARNRALQSHFCATSRAMISMPPDHGAQVVATILADEQLNSLWRKELATMQANIAQRRAWFAAALNEKLQTSRWDFLREQHGMFSLLPLDKEIVANLRRDHAIYLVGRGRINFAGLPTQQAAQKMANCLAQYL